MTDAFALARECGFSTAEPLDVSKLEFLPEVRGMCAADRCRSYNRNWSCPPACGELDEIRARAGTYSKGILLQTIGDREDSFDFEAMEEAMKLNNANVRKLLPLFREVYPDCMPMAAGACTSCESCTYPDAPCRFPELLSPSMEACGLFVSRVCSDNGVPYYYGDEKIAYTSCILYNE